MSGALLAPTVSQAQSLNPPQDLLLVLAVDSSGSVDPAEYRLQLDGLAAAFRDPEVQAAITAGPNGRIAVNLLLWADARFERFTTGWTVIDGPEHAERFARVIETFDKRVGGGTGIGAAIAQGIGLIETSGLSAPRRVIDVSGDGIEAHEGPPPPILLKEARELLVTTDIVVNGLAIETDFPRLAGYYRKEVAHGPGSFVVSARTYEDFAAAIRDKLIREIEQKVVERPGVRRLAKAE
ncbi:MAG: DUF1194 domain-containing protein [Hyphomicrobiaceae bacterium]